MKSCHNYIPLKTRALLRRLGTRVYATIEEDLKGEPRLFAFTVNLDLNYIVIFADKKIVIYGRKEDELWKELTLKTPYGQEELPDLDFAQHCDTLFVVHADHPPHQLIREDTEWFYKPIQFQETPSLGETIIGEKPHTDISLHIPHGKENTVEGRWGRYF